MSRSQKLNGLVAASLRLKTLNDNPYPTSFEHDIDRTPMIINNICLVLFISIKFISKVHSEPSSDLHQLPTAV